MGMPEEWLIDGYNLLHDLAVPKEQKSQKTREQMFALLAEFASNVSARCVLVVLDGTGNDDDFTAYQTRTLRIVYSQKVSADSYIEKYLFEKRTLASYR
jgi:predicted RNA-binding protein with PIN domain